MIRASVILVACLSARAQSFEVASVKPVDPNVRPGYVGPRITEGNASYLYVPLKSLILYAYGLDATWRVSGGPGWVDSDRWDISATLPRGTQRDQVPAMLRQLLEERFALKVHRETRAYPVYALTVAKEGLKIKEASETPPPGSKMTVTHQERHNVPMAVLGNYFLQYADRPIVDRTGLAGNYDFTFDFDPKAVTDPANPGPSIFMAMREQLGLQLVPQNAPIEFVAIDSAEKPTGN